MKFFSGPFWGSSNLTSTFFPVTIEKQIEAHSNQEHEAQILSLSLFKKRANRFSPHRYLKADIDVYNSIHQYVYRYVAFQLIEEIRCLSTQLSVI